MKRTVPRHSQVSDRGISEDEYRANFTEWVSRTREYLILSPGKGMPKPPMKSAIRKKKR